MGFKTGIVGLPNVGKSTLFNALTRTAAAQAANFPFCTIEPNVGEVAVPDARLDTLAAIAASKQIIPARLSDKEPGLHRILAELDEFQDVTTQNLARIQSILKRVSNDTRKARAA